MADPHDREIQDWLRAEAAGDSDAADAAFASVFARAVPPLAPPASAWDDTAVRGAVPGHSRVWAAIAASLLLTLGGLAAAFWTAWAFDLLGGAGSLALRVVAVGTAAGTQVLDLLRHAWLPAVAVGRALGVAAATGPAAAVIALNLTIAFGAALALSRLLAPAEE